MKKKIFFSLSAACLLFLAACNDGIESESSQSVCREAMVEIVPFEGEDYTRLSYHRLDSLAWDINDRIGIFGVTDDVNNSQIYMQYIEAWYKVLSTGGYASVKMFVSNGWGFDPEQSYQAYYPIDERLTATRASIAFDFDSVQFIDPSSPIGSLGKYDHLVSEVGSPTANDAGLYSIDFKMKHVGALLELKFTRSDLQSFNKIQLYLTDDDGNQAGYGFPASLTYNLAENSYSVVGQDLVSYCLINNAPSAVAGDGMNLYLMIPPVGLQGTKIYAIFDNPIVFMVASMPATVEAGHVYSLNFEELQ